VFHLGAVGGSKPPFWDQHKEFGDTNMLVVKPAEGASLARAMGKHNMVLMNRHGVTAVGTSVKMCVFRSVFSTRNAEYQARAMALGAVSSLSRGEAELCAGISTGTTGLARSWEYWSVRLARAGLMIPERKAAPNGARRAAAARSARKPPARKKSRRR